MHKLTSTDTVSQANYGLVIVYKLWHFAVSRQCGIN